MGQIKVNGLIDRSSRLSSGFSRENQAALPSNLEGKLRVLTVWFLIKVAASAPPGGLLDLRPPPLTAA